MNQTDRIRELGVLGCQWRTAALNHICILIITVQSTNSSMISISQPQPSTHWGRRVAWCGPIKSANWIKVKVYGLIACTSVHKCMHIKKTRYPAKPTSNKLHLLYCWLCTQLIEMGTFCRTPEKRTSRAGIFLWRKCRCIWAFCKSNELCIVSIFAYNVQAYLSADSVPADKPTHSHTSGHYSFMLA